MAGNKPPMPGKPGKPGGAPRPGMAAKPPGAAGGPPGANKAGGRQGILALAIRDKNALYAAYMPYVSNGGLFIPTTKKYNLGDEVFLLLSLMDEPEKLPVAGKVVWITPMGAQGNHAAGIGVQFSEMDEGATRNKIETYLAGALKSDRTTHTM